MYFAENLRYLREQKRITQLQLAEILYSTPSAIGNYEVGRREPNITTLCQIAKYFEISLDDLILEKLKPVDKREFIKKKNIT